MKDILKQIIIIIVAVIIISGFLYFIGAGKKEEYISSLYSDHCYILGNEPKQMKHEITFNVYEDCLLYLDETLEARKNYKHD